MFPVAAFEQLAISIYVPDSGKASTLHGVGMQTAYISDGDAIAATELAKSETDTSRYFLTDVDVTAAAGARTIVVIGDSITDGVGSTSEQNRRWPDALADRLQANPAYGATVLPKAAVRKPFVNTPQGQARRSELNAWIRNSGAFDAVE